MRVESSVITVPPLFTWGGWDGMGVGSGWGQGKVFSFMSRLLMFPCLTRPSQQPLALLRGLKRRRHRNRGLQRHTVAAAWRCCVD
jgi:hypothetical protein